MRYFLLILAFFFRFIPNYSQWINKSERIDSLNNQLCIEVYNGSILKAEKLLDQGANVNTYSDNGVTPLLYAIAQNDLGMTRFLLEHHANPNLRSKSYNEDYPLILAAELGFNRIVAILISYNANVNQQNKYGLSALHYASFFNDSLTVQLLVNNNVMVDLTTNKDETPIFYAAFNGSINSLAYLLKAGANPDLSDNNGMTPLMVASQNGHPEIVYRLLLAGTQINPKNKKGLSALSYAIANKNNNVVDLLLLNNANYNENNTLSINPLAIAKITGNKPVLDSLKKIGARKNFLPCFRYAGSVGFDIRVNNKDLMTGVIIAPYDIKNKLEYSLFYYLRPFAIPILKERNSSEFYQFWERRHIIGLSVTKRFALSKQINNTLNLLTGCSSEFHFGRYRGTLINNKGGIYLSPHLGVMFTRNRFDYRLQGQYIQYKTNGLADWYVSVSVRWNFKFKFVKNCVIDNINYKE